MTKVYTNSKLSINPDNIIASDIYTGVILQGECIKSKNDTDEDHLEFRNKSADVYDIVETKINGKVVIHHSGESDITASFNPESILLVTDYSTITEKKAIDIEIGDNLVDGNYYQKFLEKDEDAVPVFVQNIEFIEGEFDGFDIILDDTRYDWYGIFVDDMFVKYQKS